MQDKKRTYRETTGYSPGWLFLMIAMVLFMAWMDQPPSEAEKAEDRVRAAEISKRIDYANEHGTEEAATLYIQAYITTRLKSPSTATFRFHSVKLGGPNYYYFSGYVDSQNSFGAMIRTRFEGIAQYTGSHRYKMVEITYV